MTDYLDDLVALSKRATPGPWELHEGGLIIALRNAFRRIEREHRALERVAAAARPFEAGSCHTCHIDETQPCSGCAEAKRLTEALAAYDAARAEGGGE